MIGMFFGACARARGIAILGKTKPSGNIHFQNHSRKLDYTSPLFESESENIFGGVLQEKAK